ncbi:hypothetical protein [Halalkalibacter lacteus]|uniref:hypothetical protein n=1 Tax=Halalkalibacter lacteus TaxID=3090663 RepID=UPI003D6642FF
MVSFKRLTSDEVVLVFHNVSKESAAVTVDEEDETFNQVYYSTFDKPKLGATIDLPPYST